MTASSQLYTTVPTSLRSFHGACFPATRLRVLNASFPLSFSSLPSTVGSHRTLSRESPQSPQIKSSSLRKSSWLDGWINSRKSPYRPKKPRVNFDYRCRALLSDDDYEGPTLPRGGEMADIVARLKNPRVSRHVKKNKEAEKSIEKGSVEDILCCDQVKVPNKFGGFSPELPFGELLIGDSGRVSNFSMAKLTLPASEVERLKNLGFITKKKTSVGDAGVTQAIVNSIHERWKTSEIVKVKVSGTFATNMKRTHEILESKTGGLVVWRSGSSVVLFRGSNFDSHQSKQNEKKTDSLSGFLSSNSADDMSMVPSKSVNSNEEHEENLSNITDKKESEGSSGMSYANEIDKLLDSLGPRYTDWPGDGPLPVDADLLPKTIPNYQPPFRLLPYGMRPSAGLRMSSHLRRISKAIAPHFAVGRCRMHQGLATAMVKLWEVCSIAKITLKRVVMPNMGEQIAKDIKVLTGGVILSRNKRHMIFYRGNNFISRDVSEALLELERLAKSLLDEEEKMRLRALTWAYINSQEMGGCCGTAGTLGETLEANSRYGKRPDDGPGKNIMAEAEEHRRTKELKHFKRRLSSAEWKLSNARRALSAVEGFQKPVIQRKITEVITDEERSMLRRLGLKMKPVLFVGRRGIFAGTLENVHLHWKYRDVVKIFVHAHNIDQVNGIASSLVAESGGILVSIDRLFKKYAVVIYRGRDYRRPRVIRPKNLLTKRKALERLTELQRCQALENHIFYLEQSIEKLRLGIKQVGCDPDEEDELYCGVDTTEEDEEEEGDGEGDVHLSDSEGNDTDDDPEMLQGG